MYNRYVPQPDGSYRRNRVAEQGRKAPQEQPAPPPCDEPREQPCPRPIRREEPIGGFLRQLLPKDFDTGDLFIVLLLLLMAGDCEESRSNALLTLALYFVM